MAMREQERPSLLPEMARMASDEPQSQLLGLGPTIGRSAASMATGDMSGDGAGEGERGPDEAPDNVRSSSPWAALLSVVSSGFQRKPRSHVPRAVASHPWGLKLPVLQPAPAKKKAKKRLPKKRAGLCVLCDATETPLWRTLPTDRQVKVCNACGIRVRTPGAVLPKHLHLPPPAMATKTTVVSEQEQPPPQEIQCSESPPGSPILHSMQDLDVYLLRTAPRRENSPPPPPTAESAVTAAAPAPDNKDKEVKWCQHCGTTSSLQWRTGPMGPSTLCNPCGVRYRQGRLVPEYRPRASPTFNQWEHSNRHREVLQLREMKDRPAPPAAFQPSRTRKRRKGKEQQQVRKKRKGSKEQNDQPAQPAAMAVLQVRKKSIKGKAQRLPPEPALLKLRKEQLPPPPPAQLHAGDDMEMEQRLLLLPPALPHAGDDHMVHQHHLPPPRPPALLPHAVDDMVRQEQLPPPPPVQPHAGYDMVPYQPLPSALHAGDDMEMEQQLLLLPPAPPHAGDEMVPHYLPSTPAPEPPHAADDMEMEQNLLPLPPAPPGFKHPVVQPTPAKKKLTKKAKKRPAEKRVRLPEQVHLPPPATATTVVSEEQDQAPPQEIQDLESPPDSPILDSMLGFNVYLLKRTSPRREESPPPPPTADSAVALAPDSKDKQVKWCLHCGTTSSLQWRTGPVGPSTLCNACGVRYRQGRLVPEYRPRASPTFNQSEHSYKHREVLQFREMQDHPAPPAPFQPSRNRKRRNGKEQHQPAQVRKKRKGSKEQNDQPTQPPAAVRKKSKGKELHRGPLQPMATQPHAGDDMVQQHHLPPPPPPVLLPHASDDMVWQQLLPPPAPAQPHAGYDMVRYLPLPPALLHTGDHMEMEQHLLLLPPALLHERVHQYLPPTPPPELPNAADDMEMERLLLPLPPALPDHAGNDMEQHLLPLPLAQPHAGDEQMMGEPIPPLDPFLFDGPAAPRIIDGDEPVIVIVIDDD